MANALILIIIILFILPIFIGSVFLQIVLSKKKHKLLGLILPMMTLLMAILIIGIINFNSVYNNSGALFSSIWISMIFSIPTIIYLGIYFGYSKHRKELMNKNNNELIKMNIQDLE